MFTWISFNFLPIYYFCIHFFFFSFLLLLIYIFQMFNGHLYSNFFSFLGRDEIKKFLILIQIDFITYSVLLVSLFLMCFGFLDFRTMNDKILSAKASIQTFHISPIFVIFNFNFVFVVSHFFLIFFNFEALPKKKGC